MNAIVYLSTREITDDMVGSILFDICQRVASSMPEKADMVGGQIISALPQGYRVYPFEISPAGSTKDIQVIVDNIFDGLTANGDSLAMFAFSTQILDLGKAVRDAMGQAWKTPISYALVAEGLRTAEDNSVVEDSKAFTCSLFFHEAIDGIVRPVDIGLKKVVTNPLTGAAL